MKKLIYEVFQHTDVEPNLTQIADVYSDGCVVSRWRDDEPSRVAREELAGGDINKLKELGARRVYAAVTHGVLSGDAVERIEKSPLEKLVITDSIPLKDTRGISKIDIVSLAPLLSKIIIALEK